MKKTLCCIFFLVFISIPAISQTDCFKACEKAEKDFNNSYFAFHSKEFNSSENTFLFVLREYYKINWYYTDSVNFYACYDSLMTTLLTQKYGNKFMEHARMITDSLNCIDNWQREARFPGGEEGLNRFIWSKLSGEKIQRDLVRAKMIIAIEVDSTGKVNKSVIWKGINKEIDKKIISILKLMPDWEPGYLYGRPTKQLYVIPITINY